MSIICASSDFSNTEIGNFIYCCVILFIYLKMRKTTDFEKSLNSDSKSGLHCQHCGKLFKYESERKRHEQSHSPQFSCKVCNKNFSFMSALRRHEKQHERTGSVDCHECNRKFRDESLLKRHMQYAHKGNFTCSKCTTVFSSDIALRSHMKTHNPESERRFRCSFEGCKKTFNFAHHLKHHELTHTNTKQYFCSECGKGFIQYHHLKSHLKRHIQCSHPSCELTFPSAHALKKHLAIHHEECTKAVANDSDVAKEDNIDLELQVQDLKIQSDCYDSETIVDESDNTKKEDTFQRVSTEPMVSVDPVSITTCNTFLGGCIMENDGINKKNCLCAQMPCQIEDTYDFVAQNVLNTLEPMPQTSDDNSTVKINSNKCSGCNCKRNDLNHNINESPHIEDLIEYKSNGTIKIKDTIDMELDDAKNDKSEKILLKDLAIDTVPFNSCKAVLGTCIVSGNGVIGEGCLCAKMAVDDQPMIEQEIDELTPCPKMY